MYFSSLALNVCSECVYSGWIGRVCSQKRHFLDLLFFSVDERICIFEIFMM